MTRLTILATLAPLAFVAAAAASDLTGTYSVPNATGGVLTVELRQDPDGTLRGRIASEGAEFPLEGRVDDDGYAVGRVQAPGGVLAFEAETDGAILVFAFGEIGFDGDLDWEAATEWTLTREGAAPVGAADDAEEAVAAPADGDVLAQGAHGALTRDAALAFHEALVFSLRQLGAADLAAQVDVPTFLAQVAQAYPAAPPDVQTELASARAIWNRVQEAWPTLAPQQQLEIVHAVVELALGPQAATQLTGLTSGGTGGARSGGSGGVPGFDVNPSYEGQGCWAAAGCGGYETSGGDVVDYGGGVE